MRGSGRRARPDDDGGASTVTLRRQLSITLAVAGAVLLLIVTAAAYSLTQVFSVQGRVTGFYYDAIVSGDDLSGWLDDASTALDAYVVVGYEPGLAPFDESPQSATQDVRAALVEELGEGSSTVNELDAAVDAATAWRTGYAEPVLALPRTGGSIAVPTGLDRLGVSLYATARADASEFTRHLRTDRDLAAQRLTSSTRLLFVTVLILTLAALGVGLGVWFTLQRRILEPLADLAAKVEAVSAGSLDQAVHTHAPGEIATLANAVDSMRVALVEQMAEASSSRAEIAEAHRQVTEQAEELRRSNRDLEQFAYVASHDLQEPLRKVASFTQLLQKRYGGQLDDRADQYIEFAVDGAKRMQRLIQDLLGFSRVGRSLDEPRTIALADALDEALVNLEPALEGLGARIEVSDLPTVVGQPTLLVQLFQNLVGNAIKFRSPDRPPVVSIGAERRSPAGRSGARTTASGWTLSTPTGSSSSSRGSIPKTSMRGRGSGSRCARRSWNTTVGTSGSTPPRTSPTAAWSARPSAGPTPTRPWCLPTRSWSAVLRRWSYPHPLTHRRRPATPCRTQGALWRISRRTSDRTDRRRGSLVGRGRPG